MSVFKNTDWDDDVPDNKDKFQHKKVMHTTKVKKKSKKNKQIDGGNEEESVGGLFVRIRPESSGGNLHESETKKSKKKKGQVVTSGQDIKQANKNRKRKLESEAPNQKLSKKIKFSPPSEEDNSKSNQQQNNKSSAGGDFANKLRANLKGSRFRFLNEELYRKAGHDAFKLFSNDPKSFHAYHDGYRAQVQQWPLNPLKRLVNSIRKIPKNQVIADFGCGEAILAKSVPHKVYSLDLVAANADVIACDMAKTPLKTGSINVAVFCLSLMGTNLKDFICEANRVLAVGGRLKIAEVSSRFDDVNDFVKNVERCGFQLLDKDLSANLFYFMTFKKERNLDKILMNSAKHFSLKPCLYKKR